jgi:hypothetical protein
MLGDEGGSDSDCPGGFELLGMGSRVGRASDGPVKLRESRAFEPVRSGFGSLDTPFDRGNFSLTWPRLGHD